MTMSSSVVLLVEGDIVIRHPLAEYLRECGFTVFEASNGEEAKRALLTSDIKIEFVLADMTTEGSGFGLRRWIKDQNHPAEVILAGTIEKAVDHAADICSEGPAVVKPYEHKFVLDYIRQAIARRDRGREG